MSEGGGRVKVLNRVWRFAIDQPDVFFTIVCLLVPLFVVVSALSWGLAISVSIAVVTNILHMAGW